MVLLLSLACTARGDKKVFVFLENELTETFLGGVPLPFTCRILTVKAHLTHPLCQVFSTSSIDEALEGAYSLYMDTHNENETFENIKAVLDAVSRTKSLQHVVWGSFLTARIASEKTGTEATDNSSSAHIEELIHNYLTSISSLDAITTRVYSSLFYEDLLSPKFINLDKSKSRWVFSFPIPFDSLFPLCNSAEHASVVLNLMNTLPQKGDQYFLASDFLTPKEVVRAFSKQRMGLPLIYQEMSPSTLTNLTEEINAVSVGGKIPRHFFSTETKMSLATYLSHHKTQLRNYIRSQLSISPKSSATKETQTDDVELVCKED